MAMTEPQVETRSDPAPEGSAGPVTTAGGAMNGHGAEGTTAAVAEPPAWPTSDLARRRTAAAGPTGTSGAAGGGAGVGTSSGAIGDASVDPSSVTTPASQWSARDDAPARPGPGAMAVLAGAGSHRPTKFLADLTRAMRTAADESRQVTLEQFKADAASYMEEIRSEATVFAAQCREQAAAEVEALNEWSRTEMERIRRETEEGITARRQRLDDDLASQNRRLDAAMESVDATVTGFQADMERFFERLMQEEEPSTFAAMAGQLPEPPRFAPWSPEGPPADEPPNGHGQSDGMASAGSLAMVVLGSSPDARPDPNAAGAAMRASGPSDPSAPVSAEPDPAAGAPAVATSAGDGAASRHRSTGSYPTEIVVVGLVSVASIATFKRLLGRTPGIRAVHVSSGPSGEFVFGINHDQGVDVQKALMDLPDFDAQVVDIVNNVISAVVTDPEQA